MWNILRETRGVEVYRQFARSFTRKNCNSDPDPRCSPKSLNEVDCKEPPKWPNTMWNIPACCTNPCSEDMPRFDALYYKRTDKATRVYQQTWADCPPPIKKVKTCVFDKLCLPPIEKRPKCNRPQTACASKPVTCPGKRVTRCLKINLPGCRSKRITFHCLYDQNPSTGCPKRECAPYPSFSECLREKLRPGKRVECGCTDFVNMCEVWRQMVKNMMIGRTDPNAPLCAPKCGGK